MSDPRFQRLSAIASAMGFSKSTVREVAIAQQWPTRAVGNRVEYCPPEGLGHPLQPTDVNQGAGHECALRSGGQPSIQPKRVTYADLAHSPEARDKVLRREAAVLRYRALVQSGGQVEASLRVVSIDTRKDIGCSPNTLRAWVASYDQHGLDGLVEQKRGRVGARPLAAHLTPGQLAAAKARALETGSAARAYRDVLVADPDLPAELRTRFLGTHASKSHVPRSVRQAITPGSLTVAHAQGPRAARLAGPHAIGDYSDVRAGDFFCSDDMTSNILCWKEAANKHGYEIVQAQILPMLDVGSLRWLNVRVISRPGGAYSADDIWGLIGDTFDRFGLPRRGFVFERGTWEAGRVIGYHTHFSGEHRVGGLRSLGLEVRTSYDPRSKIIESAFNHLQTLLDVCPGWAGRDQRKQLPEKLKKQLSLAESGKLHPRDFLHHITQLADHVEKVMTQLNDERNDGIILRGSTPNEKWLAESAGLSKIPDSHRYLYRSHFNVVRVTRNGVRLTQGTGGRMVTHYYSAPELVPLIGSEVTIFWNANSPQTDAVIMTADAGRRFICIARHADPIARFSATDEQVQAEMRRQQAMNRVARTELRAIQPYLVRSQRVMPVVSESPVADAVRQATERQAAREADAATVRQSLRLAGRGATPEDIASITRPSEPVMVGRGSPRDTTRSPEQTLKYPEPDVAVSTRDSGPRAGDLSDFLSALSQSQSDG